MQQVPQKGQSECKSKWIAAQEGDLKYQFWKWRLRQKEQLKSRHSQKKQAVQSGSDNFGGGEQDLITALFYFVLK